MAEINIEKMAQNVAEKAIQELRDNGVFVSRWIPVSDRSPHKGEYGKVLVTYVPSGGTLWTTVIIAHYSDLMGIAKPSFHIGEVGKKSFQNITEQVIAWMPLPEPYEPKERSCEDCSHYGKLSLDCGRCDDDCSMYEPQESEGSNADSD